MSKKALILIDFENEWIDENSDYFVGDISDEIEKTNNLIDFCRKNDYKIIFIKHIEEDSDDTFVKDSKNVEIISSVNKLDSDLIIEKTKISPFYKTTLEDELKDMKDVVICGILANLCVRSCIQDAYDRDFNIKVIKDCCVSFDKKTQNFTFADLKNTREEIEFFNLNEFLSI